MEIHLVTLSLAWFGVGLGIGVGGTLACLWIMSNVFDDTVPMEFPQ